MTYIPYGTQYITKEDIEQVTTVLQSDWLTQGPVVERFEKLVAEYCGVKYAVAVNSATSALHIACLAAGLTKGDTLWTSPNTFVASANCGIYCGAAVDFVDIDSKTYNISPEELNSKFKQAASAGNLPKVLVPVHFSGQSCEMAQINELAKHYGTVIIEDASHALGGKYKTSTIGSCTYSDMTVFSFHPVKIITTGEGGMVLTNKSELYEKLLLLRSHGITRNQDKMENAVHGPWYYQQIDLGFNYRITDIQSALGVSQLTRLDEFIKRRQAIAKRYDFELSSLPLGLPYQRSDSYSAYHLYIIRVDEKKTGIGRKEVFIKMREAGIGVNVHYIPVHTQPYYRRLGFRQGQFPEAERYYQEAISIPMYYALTDEKQGYVIQKIKEILEQ